MAENKTKMRARLKAMRKKYGLGEFKNKSYSKKRGHSSMARHKKYSKRSKASGYGFLGKLLGATVYGGVREKVSMKLEPITAKIPMGNISDEVVMGGSAYLIKKFAGSKVPMLVPVLDAAMIIEAARVGEAVAKGQLGLGGSSASASSGYFS